jgi:NADH-quinone oxidoreductase subunit L
MWFSKLTSIIDWDIYDQKIVDAWGLITLKFSIKSGEADYNWLDQKIIDGFGKFANYFGSELRATQSGVVQNYLMGGIVGLVAIILIFQ